MTSFVSGLEPAAVWAHFDRLLEIPRGSGREDAARAHVRDVAAGARCEVEEDGAGNVLVRKPATDGRAEAPAVALQAHLDMVQEKNAGVDHDFATDPIVAVRDGEWLGADGTTLGADNGIGVATMLAILEADDLRHGPLELLFTVDEETGLTGAKSLPADWLSARRLINLDSEEEGVITIGCAGGGDSRLHLPLERAEVDGGTALELRVSGLRGGHSGVDIHRQRGNAVRTVARAALAAVDASPARLIRLSGGNARNAIPREASCALWIPGGASPADARAAADASLAATASELAVTDPDLRVRWSDVPAPGEAWTEATTRRGLDLLNALPHGVMAMSPDLPGLVETSVNLAMAEEHGDHLFVMVLSRSSREGAMEAVRRRVRSIAELAGARVEEGDPYPGWQPDVESKLLATLRQVYEAETGEAPGVGAMHAGLECGIIGRKYEGMDMVSFGPQIEFPHSPDERIRIPSVAPFYEVLCRTLERMDQA